LIPGERPATFVGGGAFLFVLLLCSVVAFFGGEARSVLFPPDAPLWLESPEPQPGAPRRSTAAADPAVNLSVVFRSEGKNGSLSFSRPPADIEVF
jgi:hypothetical protein